MAATVTHKAVGILNSSNPSTSAIIFSSRLPEDIIIFILKRLPVKSILQFKCVSKSWLSLLSSPEFVSLHLQHSSQNPQNHAFIIHIGDVTHSNAMCLINSNSFETTESLPLRNPCPAISKNVKLAGSVNGLVCLSCPLAPLLYETFLLWNPAMNLCKTILPSGNELCKAGEDIFCFSHGFGYDSVHDDYKIIRIVCLKHVSESIAKPFTVRAEVYSANLDCWKEVKVELSFIIINGCNMIAKGVPYWRVIIYHPWAEAGKGEFGSVVWYDFQQESFKYVPGLQVGGDNGAIARLVDWKGKLAALVYSPSRDRSDFLDIWEYVVTDKCWKKISTYGPIPVKLERYGALQCSKEGFILAESLGWELILYDPVTNHVKEFCFPDGNSFQTRSYIESLISFKEMKQDKDKLYH